MGNLVLTGATSGSATVQATDAQTVTITLPASSGTLASTGANTFTADQTINGLTVGKGVGSVSTNTALGVSALGGSVTGGVNTAVGYQSLYTNTSGVNNTGVGVQALKFNTTGSSNSSLGYGALYSNSTGSYNTAVGQDSLNANTTASNNTAVGYQALYSNTAQSNCAVGTVALYSNTTGTDNTAIGNYETLYSNTTGSNNIAVGRQALRSNVTSSQSTAVGYQAGYNATGGRNTFVGDSAGYSVTSGTNNTIIGRYNGNQNSINISTLSNKIVLSDGDGNPALYCNDTLNSEWRLNASSGSTYAGILTWSYINTTQAQMYYVNSNSRLIVYNGSAGVYLAAGGTSWTSNSDERKKDIIEPITDAANKVSTLRTVIGKYKTDAEGTRRPFLIAQDVQAVFPEAVDAQNLDDLGVAYSDMVPLLVAAIKELNTKVTALEAQLGAK
jgi:hypothetical protein